MFFWIGILLVGVALIFLGTTAPTAAIGLALSIWAIACLWRGEREHRRQHHS